MGIKIKSDIMINDGTNDLLSLQNLCDSNIYSTTEKRVGTWIDGKPIYRKIIIYESNTALGTEIVLNHNVSNIGDYRAVVRGGFYRNNTWYYGYANSTSFGFFTAIKDTQINGYLGSGWSNLFKKAFVVIEYTKTTD